jgi:tight adherence protein C
MHIILDYFYRVLPNIEYVFFLTFVFFAVVSCVVTIGFVLNRRETGVARLPKLLSLGRYLSKARPKLLEEEGNNWVTKVAKPLHTVAEPDDEKTKNNLKKNLVQAGLSSRQAYRNFLAAKVVLALLLMAGYLLWTPFVGFSVNSMFIACVLAAVGLYFPNLFIRFLALNRKQGLVRALPDALDLMVICVQAGLGLDLTFKRVGEEIRPLSKDLSDEFHLTNLEISAGNPRDESLKNMALRTGVAEISNLMNILNQAGRFGTSVASALVVHNEDMRTKRSLIAEEKAAKSAVLLMLPLLCFIFPALFIVLLGPAGIQIATLFGGLR